MKRSFKFLSFRLFLVLGTTIVIFNSCGNFLKNKSTYDKGVIINGVKWATRNVDAPGTFAAKPEDAGMFYQWKDSIGWSATDLINSNGDTIWNDCYFGGISWEKANDPSPAGWRVPTVDEIKALFDTDKVCHEWTTINGVSGRKFTDKTTGNSLFLPAAGLRYYSDGALFDAGEDGCYWSSTAYKHYETHAYYLYFYSDNAEWDWDYFNRSYGFSVRAVAE